MLQNCNTACVVEDDTDDLRSGGFSSSSTAAARTESQSSTAPGFSSSTPQPHDRQASTTEAGAGAQYPKGVCSGGAIYNFAEPLYNVKGAFEERLVRRADDSVEDCAARCIEWPVTTPPQTLRFS